MTSFNFCKFHGFGNDYIVIERSAVPDRFALPELPPAICHRNTGVGSDGIAVIEKLPDDNEVEYLKQSIAIDQKLLGENNPELAEPSQNLGIVLTRQKRFAEAEQHLQKALSLHLLRHAPNHWIVATNSNLLGACLSGQKSGSGVWVAVAKVQPTPLRIPISIALGM